MPSDSPLPCTILIIVCPHFNLAATTAFIDPFRAANYLSGHTRFRWEIASLNGDAVIASNGMAIHTRRMSAVHNTAQDFVILSSSWSPESQNSPALRAALRNWARAGSTMGALDTGAFILADAGLLKGKRATAHYEHIDAFRELYPDTVVCEDLFVFDDKRITCCGGIAASDFALHIIRGTHTQTLASETARYLFLQSLRPQGTQQNPEAAEPLGSTVPVAVKQAIGIMEAHLEEPVSIPDICDRVGVSQRQLDRLFTEVVRKSPVVYYRDIRLDRARGLVTQTSLSITEIGIASGFSNQSHFSKAYRQRFGLTPRQDRREGRIPFDFRAWPMHQITS